jgi:hypothetical protein
VSARIRTELAKLWPSLPSGAIERALKRIAALEPTDDEVCAFARAARHALDTGNCVGAFERLHLAPKGTFGAAFTLERFGPWLERRRAARAPSSAPSSAPPVLSSLQQAEAAARKVRSS